MKALHKERGREKSQMRWTWTDTAGDLCKAVGLEKELPKTGAGHMPSRGRERCCKNYRAIKVLITIAAVRQCNRNFHNFALHVKLISVLIPATPSVTTMITIVHGGHVQSTPFVKRAALGHLLFASRDPHHQPTSPEASNDWLRLTAHPQVGQGP